MLSLFSDVLTEYHGLIIYNEQIIWLMVLGAEKSKIKGWALSRAFSCISPSRWWRDGTEQEVSKLTLKTAVHDG